MKKDFNLDFEIYDASKILESIEDFKEVSKIKLENNTLTITGSTENEIEEIFNEFMNYNIGLING
ncbi:hypothetical protein A9Q91_05320 [Candidatus Gracilibacteria bacterium 28_42_T64]|nr:hypothetical protein A9Q91_05320 [Candidatus Gracilibacteria bacterium 28_42_T64]